MSEYSEPLVGIRPSELFLEKLQNYENKHDELNADMRNILENKNRLIPFKTIHRICDTLNDGENKKLYLHEMLHGCEIDFWKPPKPKRNPELEARIQKLKAEQEEREYHEMTKNVSMSSFKKSSSFQSEIRTVRSQITAVLNGVLTVAGTFIFGFKAAEYLFSISDLITKFCVGFSLAILVAVAELYFLIPIV
ncbi:transmembrane protein 199 [Centruroides vittatus]|uniref:transmembrane protein 199 n=1 Tax=Centruroides vittatus TaxID=120091 RepID=UPI00350EA77C